MVFSHKRAEEKRKKNLERLMKGPEESEEIKVFGGFLEKTYEVSKIVSWNALKLGYGAILRHKYQKRFSDRPWLISTINALTLGLGKSAIYYYGGDEAVGAIDEYVLSWVAGVVDLAVDTLIEPYAIWDAFQSLGRVAYTTTTKKGIMSFSMSGLLANGLLHPVYVRLRKRRMDKFKQNNKRKLSVN